MTTDDIPETFDLTDPRENDGREEVAPQKFLEVDEGQFGIVMYDDVEKGEWIEAEAWVDARDFA